MPRTKATSRGYDLRLQHQPDLPYGTYAGRWIGKIVVFSAAGVIWNVSTVKAGPQRNGRASIEIRPTGIVVTTD